MKYFTLSWWADSADATPFKAYETYLTSVKERLPAALRRLAEEVDLHDSRLRRLLVDAGTKALSLELEGWALGEGEQPGHALKIGLAYKGLISFETRADPEAGLPGPYGYGDLGYHEIEVLDSGRFQHRMLFSNGIEFAVTFTDFTLTCARDPEIQR